jgi:hypothetical protein
LHLQGTAMQHPDQNWNWKILKLAPSRDCNARSWPNLKSFHLPLLLWPEDEDACDISDVWCTWKQAGHIIFIKKTRQ